MEQISRKKLNHEWTLMDTNYCFFEIRNANYLNPKQIQNANMEFSKL